MLIEIYTRQFKSHPRCVHSMSWMISSLSLKYCLIVTNVGQAPTKDGDGSPPSVDKGMARLNADPAALIRLYEKHGLGEDACHIAQLFLESWATTSTPLDRSRPAAVYMPISLLQQAADIAPAPYSGALKSALDGYIARARAESEVLKSATAVR